MQPEQALDLIRHPAITVDFPTNWADLGSGSGLFSHALASLLVPGSKIFAIDKNTGIFERHQKTNEVIIETMEADFITESLKIHDLDGILMANSLHFVAGKIDFISKLSSYFAKQECFLIVEYDMDMSNPWVPFPISFHSLQKLFQDLDYHFIQKIDELPSRYNRSNIYSALVKR
ncbi:MAG: methyltransferase type 11 [Chitinophagaceae bacterium]|nr:methyltransferase type 11 [Chitinophagaceae bacterium]